MEQVLMNLVVNARDAMPDGGRLTIETASVYLDSAYADSRPGMKPGRYVMISVSDTGTGMTPETVSLIFEPFFTTKSKDKGTGLGLSMVYGIVKQHEGDIHVYSEPGHGTTFKIYLPNIQDTSTDEPEIFAQKTPEPGTGQILLVEDEPSVRKLTFNILTGNGYSVMAAASAEDAILQAKAHKEPIDLLLTDVILPGMKGPDLKEEINKIHPETLVLFMSGYSGEMIS
jgi:two-component system, cell cycle sensor histidine kinase and response regulator CckA